MSKKKKIFFRVSIGLNVLFLLVVVWGFFKINHLTERTLFSQVEVKLLELEDAITHQKDNNWSQPSLVTTSMQEALYGLDTIRIIGAEFKTLSKGDIELLYNLSNGLKNYYRYSLLDDSTVNFFELSDTDKKNYEELGNKLLKVGFRELMREDTDSNIRRGTFENMDIILSRIEELVESIGDTE